MITLGIILLTITLFSFIYAISINALYLGDLLLGISVLFAIGLSCLLYGIYKKNNQNDDNDELK